MIGHPHSFLYVHSRPKQKYKTNCRPDTCQLSSGIPSSPPDSVGPRRITSQIQEMQNKFPGQLSPSKRVPAGWRCRPGPLSWLGDAGASSESPG